MEITTAYSQLNEIDAAIEEIKNKFSGFDAKMILFFASSNFDPERTAAKFKEAFTDSITIGCSTAGEIVSGKMLKNSVVAMGLGHNVIGDLCFGVLQHISSEIKVDQIFGEFEEYYQTPMEEMDFQSYVGLILTDGLSGAEEQIMDRIGDLTNVFFVGASAGDDLKFVSTHVYADGKAYKDASLLVLLKPLAQFDFIKTQSFTKRSEKLVPTKVAESSREVLEFNGMPAAKAYAQALKLSEEEAENRFMANPVGLMVDGEPYVRSPQRYNGNSMIFYCKVVEGMELSVLQSEDIVSDTKAAIEKKRSEMGGISGIINFHCILRTLELEQKEATEAYGKIFSDIPTIGFSTYGESFLGHINQTSTMLIFGDEKKLVHPE